jgi:hypothetical protein
MNGDFCEDQQCSLLRTTLVSASELLTMRLEVGR